MFGVVFFVFKSLLGIKRQKKVKKFTIFTRKPRNHVRILLYRTWPIAFVNNTSVIKVNGVIVLPRLTGNIRALCTVLQVSLMFLFRVWKHLPVSAM